MNIEFKESSWIKYHYGALNIESENGDIQHSFTLIENYDHNTNNTEFEVVWPDGPPHNYKRLEAFIVEEFSVKEHS